MNEQKVVDICNRILVFKRKEILTHATTWINLKGMRLSETSPSEKDKNMV
jgi:hypothetical protein